jgi:hypothetical protein
MKKDIQPYPARFKRYLSLPRKNSRSTASYKFKPKKGLISIAKFKAISQLIWTKEQGLEWGDVLQNRG